MPRPRVVLQGGETADLLALTGVKWLLGVGAPSDEDGDDGDLYLDRDTTNIYVKEDGSWH